MNYNNFGIEIRRAGEKGLGVFTTKNFKKDEVVIVNTALLFIPPDGESQLHSYTFSAPDCIDEMSALAVGEGSMLNHSNKPNLDWNQDWDPELKRFFFVFKANKNIKESEELTINYGWDENNYDWVIQENNK